MHKNWIRLAAALVCAAALTACGTQNAPVLPEEPTVPLELSPTSLGDRLYVLPDFRGEKTVVYNGQVLARGDARSVIDLSTGEIVGYSLLEVDLHNPNAPLGEYPDLHYNLYRKDGTFWQDCGGLLVTGVLDDWVYGMNTIGYDTFVSQNPSNRGTWIPAVLTNVTPSRCLAWSTTGDFLGIHGVALVDGQCEILSQLKTDQEPSFNAYDPPPDYLSLEGIGAVNTKTFAVLPYKSVTEINDGYTVFRTLDDRYDLKDKEGNTVLTNYPQRITFYGEHIRIETTGAPDSIETRTEVYIDGALAHSDPDMVTGYWDGGVYVQCNTHIASFTGGISLPINENGTVHVVELYDFTGQPMAEYTSSDFIYADLEENVLTVWKNDYPNRWIGNQPYKLSPSKDRSTLYDLRCCELSVPRYTLYYNDEKNPRKRLCDLLDEQGNLLKSHFSGLGSTDYPGLYCAQRGFSYGIIDQNGNWLWREPIFAANENEIDD